MSNAFDDEKWCVHVKGPDSALAANSFHEAVEQCERINKNIISMIGRGEFDPEYSPILWATVERWGDICPGCTHDPQETDWDEVC